MSEHSDDAFDENLKREHLEWLLKKNCPRDRTQCKWFRNEEGMLQCVVCHREVDE